MKSVQLFRGSPSERAVLWGFALLLLALLLRGALPVLTTLLSFALKVSLPFLLALFVAYLLEPGVRVLERRGFERRRAVQAVYAFFFLLVGFALALAVFRLDEVAKGVQSFLHRLAASFEELGDGTEGPLAALPPSLRAEVLRWGAHLYARLPELAVAQLEKLDNLWNFVFVVTLSPFIAYFYLVDGEAFFRFFALGVPPAWRATFAHLLFRIDGRLARYVRGLVYVAVLEGILVYLGYRLVGLPFAAVFAVLTAIFEFVPFVGPVLAAGFPLLYAVPLGWSKVLSAFAVVLVAQLVENNLLSPLISGKVTDLHPLAILTAVLVGGELLGFLGMVLAVPVSLVVREVVFAWDSLRAPEGPTPSPDG
ncbi:AI-2E family transporter [Brockia lithotrophica]|uniref:Putative PurR-regulated permease PerM n=1 Tax=Brockia lithotrophica TaxID=933949 RepID=A0A660LAD5_9BACL|nr:AI-2E family transporter [Brockia lithotrophica]RKQ88933.1 putative PurR-regulated permease PerM [Brockia lithotrophica]